MRGKSALGSCVLCALLMFGFALSAYAGASYIIQGTPVDVVKNGVAEVMGEVRLVVNVSPAPTAIAANDTITILYVGAAIADNGPGITITAVGFPAITPTVNNASTGGQLILTFAAGAAPAAGQFIAINGVRASVIGKSVGTIVTTQFSASPVGSSSFVTTTSLTVAVVTDNFGFGPAGTDLDGTIGVTADVGNADAAGTIIFQIAERDRDPFVQYVPTLSGSPVPVNTRPSFGASANSQVHLSVNNLQIGAIIYWPPSVQVAPEPPFFTGATLSLRSVRGVGNSDAVYEFATVDQPLSDSMAEIFIFALPVTSFHTSGSAEVVVTSDAALGTSTIQAQMFPSNIVNTVRPRFDDPLKN